MEKDLNILEVSNQLTSDNLTSYSYNIYSANMSADQLRKNIYFLQFKAKQLGYEFILDCAEWGLDENYINGALHLISPQTLEQQVKFEEIISIFQVNFKQEFEMITESGNSTGAEKSIFSFSDLQQILSAEDYEVVMTKGLPYLAYHSYLEDASSHIISQSGQSNSPIFWIFVALLTQDKALFNVVEKSAVMQLSTFEQVDIEHIQNIYLSSYDDGEQLAQILEKKSDFLVFFKTTQFFNEYKNIFNNIE